MNKKRYPTIFHLLSDVFAKGNATCVLIGGFAVNYYKVSRQTADVDFLITKFKNLCLKYGMEQKNWQR